MPDTAEHKDNPEADGWTRRFIACEPRLSEAVELYKESGFEVLLLDLSSEKTADNRTGIQGEKGCRECFNGVEERYRVIYTRPGKGCP